MRNGSFETYLQKKNKKNIYKRWVVKLVKFLMTFGLSGAVVIGVGKYYYFKHWPLVTSPQQVEVDTKLRNITLFEVHNRHT